MIKPLCIVAGGLLALTVAVYGLSWLDADKPVSLDELERRCLEAEKPAEQQQAALALAGRGQPAVPYMRRVLEKSGSAEVRAAMIQGLGHWRDFESMPAILDRLDDSSDEVRMRAGQAAERILGAEFGYRAADPPEKRARAARALRGEYERFKDNPPPMYRSDK